MASGFLVLSQALDDDSIHFGKLLGGEVVDPSFDLRPSGAVVPARPVVCLFKDALRFLVQDHPAVNKGIAGGFEDGGVLPDRIKEEAPDLGVAGVGGSKLQIEVGHLIIEPELEKEKDVRLRRPAGAGTAAGKFVPVGGASQSRQGYCAGSV